ncbi:MULTISPECIES: chemotaxis protein CheB [unclassified Duganella]|uniref:chemotaxis protein CheB n=1 Tax=unclassified Duganella TaxID=2636909 RepID=UPI0007003F69|nr:MULTISPECIES: chemotaxis protein CheB [unclassified Duganella]KQV42908.1 chemotaxis protein CheB [Duganella sp. Root336D2]KRB97033.1 chemotaxis protein CheB [Duganella sp. Root198D2]
MQTDPSLELAVQGRTTEAVVIGASAGGVNALLQMLPALPRGYRLPIVVVLHVKSGRQNQLVEVFQQKVALPVREAGDKEDVIPGTLYFAPAGYHLLLENDRSFSLSCDAPLHFTRPAIDITMETAADAYGAGLAGVLLTGANEDGAAGMAAIGRAGGLTVVQDPNEAEIATMPQEAINARAPDLVLPLEQIKQLLLMLETH